MSIKKFNEFKINEEIGIFGFYLGLEAFQTIRHFLKFALFKKRLGNNKALFLMRELESIDKDITRIEFDNSDKTDKEIKISIEWQPNDSISGWLSKNYLYIIINKEKKTISVNQEKKGIYYTLVGEGEIVLTDEEINTFLESLNKWRQKKRRRGFDSFKQNESSSDVPPGPGVPGATAIDLDDQDLELVTDGEDATIQDLISKQKITILNRELWFRITDKETIDTLDYYFPDMDKRTIGQDEENESLKINESFYNVYSTEDQIHGKYNKKIPAAKRKIFDNIYSALHSIASDVQFNNYSGGISHLDIEILRDIEGAVNRAADHVSTVVKDAGERSMRYFEDEPQPNRNVDPNDY